MLLRQSDGADAPPSRSASVTFEFPPMPYPPPTLRPHSSIVLSLDEVQNCIHRIDIIQRDFHLIKATKHLASPPMIRAFWLPYSYVSWASGNTQAFSSLRLSHYTEYSS